MPPKKKKTQIKKVERGFATTSIPKKAPVEPPVPESAEPPVTTENEDGAVDLQPTATSPLDAKRRELQDFADKFQEKVEKEVSRTIKTLEYDRRLTKTWPSIELSRSLQTEVEYLTQARDGHEFSGYLDLTEGTRDRLLIQLGTTYGTLTRIGFDEEVVRKCLSSTQFPYLEHAVDWLHINCSLEELDFTRGDHSIDVYTPRTPDSSSFPATPRSANERRLPAVPNYVPSDQSSLASSSQAAYESESDDDPTIEYARLKLRIARFTVDRHRQSTTTDNSALQNLKSRLEKLKGSYFFVEKEAEAEYLVMRQQAESAELLSKLRGEDIPPVSNQQKEHAPEQLRPSESTKNPDIFDDDAVPPGEDEPPGLFALLEPMPSEEVTASGVTVKVRDMSLPKRWTGKLPKMLLQELVRKSDRYAAISYANESGASRAQRASVTIRWTGGRTRSWMMDDVACHDQFQAEHYAAVLALHSLSYPPLNGFQSSAQLKGAQSPVRNVPPCFKDLWDELEEKRKADEATRDREIWESLGVLLDAKMVEARRPEEQLPKVKTSKEQGTQRSKATPDYNPANIVAGFQARQASSAYQLMLMQRNMLPIAAFRRTITEMLEMSQVLVLSGETGCGKSTQVPSFVLEEALSRGQHCRIVVTEPRRISAISLAQRVSQELGDAPGAVGTPSSLVGYSIRLESHTSKNTRLMFVTNGIALRMLESGSGSDGRGTAFDDITHIIVDEVHERSIESDFLLIVLKSLIEQRKDLKVILMSATLDAEKISNFFGGCPTVHVPGRTFPVDVRFVEDAVECTQWAVQSGSPYAKRVNDKFHRNAKQKKEWSEELVQDEDDEDQESSQAPQTLAKRYSPTTIATMNVLDERVIAYDLIIRLLEVMCFEDYSYSQFSSAFLVFMPGLGEIRRLNDMLLEHPRFGSSHEFRIHPLHSLISSENQGAVFDIPPQGVRKIVIATNIAETGITIPDITCVIDSGKHREMRFDEKRQISRLIETYVAKSNAAQRRGRAGRVRSGLCFHLFSKARFDMMADHPLPEMMRLSLSDLALRIKILKVKLGSSIEDVLSRAMDPPSSVNIQRAVAALVEVQALTTTEEITPMGRLLSKLPTDVHLGKFLLIAALFRCLDPALTIAAALNSKSPFVSPFGHEQEADRAKASFKIGNSDFLTIDNAFSSWRRASANPGFVRKFCKQNFLSHQNLQQIEELRQQFLGYLIDSSFIKVEQDFVQELNRARYARHRTPFIYVPEEYDRNSSESMAVVNAALCAGLYPKLLIVDSGGVQQLKTLSNNQLVSFHPSSVNFGRRPLDFGVNYLSYFTIMQSKKLYAWETGPVDDLAIVLLCGDVEFKLLSDTIVIDRKIKFRVPPKTGIALKMLRSQLADAMAAQIRREELTEQQLRWFDLAMRILGKIKPLEEETAGLGFVVH